MADYKTLSDNELFSLLKESDHAAYNEIYRRYFHMLYVHTYKKLRDENQAKDVIQDLFATVWFKREHDIQTDNLAAYLFTAIRNKIFDLFAHQQVEAKYVSSLKDYLSTHMSVPTDHLVRENDLKVYIEKEIQALPPKMKLMFELSRKEYLSHLKARDFRKQCIHSDYKCITHPENKIGDYRNRLLAYLLKIIILINF